MNKRFQGRVAVVTGGTSGIGSETASQLAAQGAEVAVAGRRRDHGEQVVHDIRRQGGSAIYVHTDVTSAESVRDLYTHVVRQYGRLDFAFNNAGIAGEALKLAADQTEEAWDAVINTNLRGVWLCMKHAIPAMKTTGGGAIVNTASYLGLAGAEFGVSPYVASKHGIVGLTKSAAIEYARQGIRVNAICPGMTNTDMVKPALAASEAGFAAFVDAAIPLGRIATPAEIASAVIWLLSEESSYVTGQAIAVDGGILAR